MTKPVFRELMTRYPANAGQERRQLILLTVGLVGLTLALLASLFAWHLRWDPSNQDHCVLSGGRYGSKD
jgi:hypothetical protein